MDATEQLAFPEGIEAAFKAISTETQHLHRIWIVYRRLYGTRESHAVMYGGAAGAAAGVFEEALLRQVQVDLCKLVDRTNGVLSVKKLVERIVRRKNVSSTVKTELQSLLKRTEQAAKAIMDRRNNWIAHSNWEQLESGQQQFHASRAEVETALEELRVLVNEISVSFGGGLCLYEQLRLHDDGHVLLETLAAANSAPPE